MNIEATIRTSSEIKTILASEAVILHLDVDWSIHAVQSRQIIQQFAEPLASRANTSPILIRRIDCSEQRGELYALQQSLQIGHAMLAGAGAVVWINQGKVVDCIVDAAQVGVDQLIARTWQAFDSRLQ
jgi:hypothetical protein